MHFYMSKRINQKKGHSSNRLQKVVLPKGQGKRRNIINRGKVTINQP